MFGGVRACIAAVLLLAADLRGKLSARPVAAAPSPCPPSLLERLSAPTLRAALIASLWAPGPRCLVRAAYADAGETPVLLPETTRAQRAGGHWARLAAAGYVFAEGEADKRAQPAPVLRLRMRPLNERIAA